MEKSRRCDGIRHLGMNYFYEIVKKQRRMKGCNGKVVLDRRICPPYIIITESFNTAVKVVFGSELL